MLYKNISTSPLITFFIFYKHVIMAQDKHQRMRRLINMVVNFNKKHNHECFNTTHLHAHLQFSKNKHCVE